MTLEENKDFSTVGLNPKVGRDSCPGKQLKPFRMFVTVVWNVLISLLKDMMMHVTVDVLRWLFIT